MLKQKRIIARDYRNRRIGDFLKELRLTEGRGTGIPGIYNALKSNGSPEPVFETDDDHNYFLVVLAIHPAFLKAATAADETALRILTFCKLPKSRAAILEKIGLANHSANFKKYIIPLIGKGWLASTSPAKPTSPKQKYGTTVEGKKIIG